MKSVAVEALHTAKVHIEDTKDENNRDTAIRCEQSQASHGIWDVKAFLISDFIG